MLKKVLAVSGLSFICSFASAQMVGGGGQMTIYGDKVVQEERPSNLGGGTIIQCKDNPNRVCVQVSWLTDDHTGGPGDAVVFDEGVESGRFTFEKVTTTQAPGQTELLFIIK